MLEVYNILDEKYDVIFLIRINATQLHASRKLVLMVLIIIRYSEYSRMFSQQFSLFVGLVAFIKSFNFSSQSDN